MAKPKFLSDQLVNNPGNPLEQIQDLRRRLDVVERLLISPEAADERYAQIDKSGFHVHKNGTDQSSVSGSTWTKVTWAAEVFDRAGDFDLTNSKFVPNEAGEYLFGATIKWTSFGDGFISRLALYVNGAAAWHGPALHSGSTAVIGASVNALVQLEAGDAVELYAYHTNISSRAIEGDAVDTYWWGVRMQ